jgi:hypothetical protein
MERSLGGELLEPYEGTIVGDMVELTRRKGGQSNLMYRTCLPRVLDIYHVAPPALAAVGPALSCPRHR